MRLDTDSVIPFPRERVFVAYRDEIADFTDYLPNVVRIEVTDREEEGDVVRLVNIWHGGGEVPAAVRKFLSGKALSWHDYATWTHSEHRCQWRIETHAFTEAVECRGETRLIALDERRTRLEIEGEMHVDLGKVRGVPSFVAGTLGRTVEKFLVEQISANLGSISDGITRYLQERG